MAETGGKLLLTEEEWAARQRKRPQGSSPSSGGDKGGKPKAPSGDRPSHAGKGDRKPGNSRYCGKPGHCAKECRKKERDREKRGEVANLARVEEKAEEEDERPGLYMAQGCTLRVTPVERTRMSPRGG